MHAFNYYYNHVRWPIISLPMKCPLQPRLNNETQKGSENRTYHRPSHARNLNREGRSLVDTYASRHRSRRCRFWQKHSYHQNSSRILGVPLQNKLCFGHGGKVCRVLGKFLSLKEFIFDRVASRVTFILRLPDSALQKSDQKLEICSEEESEDLSSQMLSSSFLVIHDSAGGGHDDVTEN